MSLSARRELSEAIRSRYSEAGRKERSKILDEFTASTGYGRKHAIAVLAQPPGLSRPAVRSRSSPPRLYTEEVRDALVEVWEASNQLCSKRLVPFLPFFVRTLERFGHLTLEPEVRRRLVRMSPASVDRLLYPRRHGRPRSLTSTRPGPLLKHQIAIRTFTEWNEDGAGFLEADSVTHCGSSQGGTFINSLVLTDVKTGWTECLALLYKDQDFVVQGFEEARRRFPFPIRGLDTDNGSEFITHNLVAYCVREQITFTRSRPYKKNDQCFVEQKNGQIVRRLVGYDRYEGLEAARVMAALYAVIRLYINFFQPSMRLVSKSRLGSKVQRVYDTAKTPCARALDCDDVRSSVKASLRREERSLDPVTLLREMHRLQDELWTHGYRQLPARTGVARPGPAPVVVEPVAVPSPAAKKSTTRIYHRTRKPRKKVIRWWRSWTDAFASVWTECEIELDGHPDLAATVLLERLQARYPEKYPDKLLRTLQRRVREWRIARMAASSIIARHGDSLPDTDDIELTVPCTEPSADNAPRYDFE